MTLRRKGGSIRDIESKLGIPRSTLSGWFRSVQLTQQQRAKLQSAQHDALVEARRKAVQWHNAQKQQRLAQALASSKSLLQIIDTKDVSYMKIALASLYMGEGAKKDGSIALASTDSRILRFYINALKHAYNVPISTFRIELHLREDQSELSMLRYWLQVLDLPITTKHRIYKDPRTKGKATHKGYHGVCLVSGGGVAVQRELLHIGRQYFEMIGKGV